MDHLPKQGYSKDGYQQPLQPYQQFGNNENLINTRNRGHGYVNYAPSRHQIRRNMQIQGNYQLRPIDPFQEENENQIPLSRRFNYQVVNSQNSDISNLPSSGEPARVNTSNLMPQQSLAIDSGVRGYSDFELLASQVDLSLHLSPDSTTLDTNRNDTFPPGGSMVPISKEPSTSLHVSLFDESSNSVAAIRNEPSLIANPSIAPNYNHGGLLYIPQTGYYHQTRPIYGSFVPVLLGTGFSGVPINAPNSILTLPVSPPDIVCPKCAIPKMDRSTMTEPIDSNQTE